MSGGEERTAIDTATTIDIAIVTAVALATETQTETEIDTVIAIVPPDTSLLDIATPEKIPPQPPRSPRQHLPRPLLPPRLLHRWMRNL